MKKFGTFYIKITLLIIGFLIVTLVLLYTQFLVKKISDREAQFADLYAKSLEYLANDTSTTGEYKFIYEQIITQIDFPIIATDKTKKQIFFNKNINIDTTIAKPKLNEKLLEIVEEMGNLHKPVAVMYQKDTLNLVFYGESSLITELKMLPYFEFLIGGIFLLVGYIGFSHIKKTEQSNIWVGLSKETAHQLGTPLSSLIGWLEILKNIEPKTKELQDIINEQEKDVERLSKIANRFSKIGSLPALKEEKICEVLTNVIRYFERRIPNLIDENGISGKKIRIKINCPVELEVKINRELFEWVLENLLKNALDAIDKKSGMIKINVSKKHRDINIDISDSGKGIDLKHRKDIFRPGFSTKMRGWGLGLSLAKRIIEDYHKGKLTLLESSSENRTTFRIRLKV
ncbi:MAG: HAMP domain-containing histidine kinase [Ignavibacteria bacterium]|nr:HAMP domain-containing histidine kinase [Ignavibacteria bacterium]